VANLKGQKQWGGSWCKGECCWLISGDGITQRTLRKGTGIASPLSLRCSLLQGDKPLQGDYQAKRAAVSLCFTPTA
jgi:hypothetical protein